MRRSRVAALLVLAHSLTGAGRGGLGAHDDRRRRHSREPDRRVGDPTRGRAIVADRTRGLCLLCHAGPFPEERFQGNLAPDLTGVGGRLSAGQLRLRLVDGRVLNPETIMPSYYTLAGLARVGRAWQGRTILSTSEIEDVVAFLATLREDASGVSR